MVLDLERRRADPGVSEKIHQQRTLEVRDTDALGETLIVDLLKPLPRLLDARVDGLDGSIGGVPARGVGDLGVDVFEGDGEVDEVEIEVLETPPFELLADNGLDAGLLVEGVPELGDDEELLALDDSLLDGALDTLAALLLVAVVCGGLLDGELKSGGWGRDGIPKAPSNRRYPSLMAL